MDTKRLTLSKSILEMKFMKRTKDKVEKQQFQEEGEEYFGNQVTKRMKNESERFCVQSSYALCEGLIDGRLSFQGMNPVIEKLMKAKENEKRVKEEIKRETDISDVQMAVQWQKIRAKFGANHKHKKSQQKANNGDEPIKKKPKFLKPVD